MLPAGVTADLLAFYPFEGNADDVSSNGVHGTVYGATVTEGYEGSGYLFDGLNDYVYAPLDINPRVHPQLTMGAWVMTMKINAIRQIQVISHDDSGYDRSLGIDHRGGGFGWSCFAGSSAVLGYVPIVENIWTFIAVVYDQAASSVTLYVDDQVRSTKGTMGVGNTFIRIASNPGYGEYFGGVIDNVFIYDEALSTERIAEIRENGSTAIVPPPPPPPGVVIQIVGDRATRARRRLDINPEYQQALAAFVRRHGSAAER